MKFELFISEQARNQLRELPPEIRRNIGSRLSLLQLDLTGDVKKLKARKNYSRLRVGSYRVLFRLEGARVEVYSVKQRKDAYE